MGAILKRDQVIQRILWEVKCCVFFKGKFRCTKVNTGSYAANEV
jgi:hypothetical protein